VFRTRAAVFTTAPGKVRRMRCRRTGDRSIQILPRRSAVEAADACAGDRAGLQVSGVDAHPAVLSRVDGFPVHDASARRAPDEPEPPVAPGVSARASRFDAHRNVADFVIRPKRSVTSADRAIAARELTRPSRNVDVDGAAVAGRGEHGWSLRVLRRNLQREAPRTPSIQSTSNPSERQACVLRAR
jgi:hypothetical protein